MAPRDPIKHGPPHAAQSNQLSLTTAQFAPEKAILGYSWIGIRMHKAMRCQKTFYKTLKDLHKTRWSPRPDDCWSPPQVFSAHTQQDLSLPLPRNESARPDLFVKRLGSRRNIEEKTSCMCVCVCVCVRVLPLGKGLLWHDKSELVGPCLIQRILVEGLASNLSKAPKAPKAPKEQVVYII